MVLQENNNLELGGEQELSEYTQHVKDCLKVLERTVYILTGVILIAVALLIVVWSILKIIIGPERGL